jgi:hypothetical protein
MKYNIGEYYYVKIKYKTKNFVEKPILIKRIDEDGIKVKLLLTEKRIIEFTFFNFEFTRKIEDKKIITKLKIKGLVL